MQEENHSSPYTEGQDDYSATSSLPYVEKYSPPSSASTPPPSVPQSAPETASGAVSLTNIDLLTTTHQLGGAQKIYKNQYEKELVKGLSSTMLGVLCLLPLIPYILPWWSPTGSVRVPTGALLILAIISICALVYGITHIIIGINSLVTNTLQKNVRYYMCAYGIMVIKGKQVQAIRWNQVRIARKTLLTDPPYTFLHYELHPADGRPPLVLENIFAGMNILITDLEREITHYSLPRSIAAYKAGQMLDFGAIHVTQQGLSLQSKQENLPWESIGPVDVQEASLVIKERGTLSLLATIDISEIYNLCVLLPLIKEIQNDNHTKETPPNPLRYQSPVIPTPSSPSEWQEYE